MSRLFDKDGDVAKGAAIIRNAKTRRVSVCNALDCLIIDVNRLTDLSTLVAVCSRTMWKSMPMTCVTII